MRKGLIARRGRSLIRAITVASSHGNLDSKSCARLVLHYPQGTIANVSALNLDNVGRPLAGEQRQVHASITVNERVPSPYQIRYP